MKNKTLGSTLLVAGTTIGGGMAAMPLTSAGMGFSFTLILLFILWWLLSYSALLYVELYQNAERRDAGIATLAEQHFGMLGRFLATFSLVVFMYAILAAYITGSGSLLSDYLAFLGEHKTTATLVLFTVFFAAFVVAGTSATDALTRILFIFKFIALGLVLVVMLPLVKTENLMAMPLNKFLIISASPVFFTAFGFHVVIPSINDYLENNIKKLRIAIICGTALPLACYILWQLAIHGVLPQSDLAAMVAKPDANLGDLVKAIETATGSTLMGRSVGIFSSLAMITSFLGVSLSLMECLNDLLKRINIDTSRFNVGLVSFIPPLAFALFYPQGFIMALQYAGIMFCFYGLVLPVAMVFVARKRYPNNEYRAFGGNFVLFFALILGILIMCVPFLVKAGLLPAVVG